MTEPAQAAPLSFNFVGTVSSSNIPQISVGDLFDGFIRFDTDIPQIPGTLGTFRSSPAGPNSIMINFRNGIVFNQDPSLDFTIGLADGSFFDAASFLGSTGSETIGALFTVNGLVPLSQGSQFNRGNKFKMELLEETMVFLTAALLPCR